MTKQHVPSLPQNIDRDQKITTMNDEQFFLADVIAHILHHLKCQLLREVKDFGYKELKASDFDWVITVPAIWKSKGRKMMLEAGYMVSFKLKFCLQPPNSDKLVCMHRISNFQSWSDRGC